MASRRLRPLILALLAVAFACGLAAAVHVLWMGPYVLYAAHDFALLLIGSGVAQLAAALAARVWAFLKAVRAPLAEAGLWLGGAAFLAPGGALLAPDQHLVLPHLGAVLVSILLAGVAQGALVIVWGVKLLGVATSRGAQS